MKFLYILLLVSIVILSGCAQKPTTNQTNEIDALKSIIPSDWALTQERLADEKPADGVTVSFRITSNQQCKREVTFKPDPNPVNQTINPNISVIYMKKWTQQDYDKENKKYEDCVKEPTQNPERAIGCSKSTPILDTKNYSVFIHENKCNDETNSLKEKITTYLRNL